MPEHNPGDMGGRNRPVSSRTTVVLLGTMRLGRRTTHFVNEKSIVSRCCPGAYECRRNPPYLCAEKLYRNVDSVDERHRHRYEVNPMYIDDFEAAGMKFVGRSDDNKRMEILELDSNEPCAAGPTITPSSRTRSSIFRRCAIPSRVHLSSAETVRSLSGPHLGKVVICPLARLIVCRL